MLLSFWVIDTRERECEYIYKLSKNNIFGENMVKRNARLEIEKIFGLLVKERSEKSDIVTISFLDIYQYVNYAYSTIIQYLRITCESYGGKYDNETKTCVLKISEEK